MQINKVITKWFFPCEKRLDDKLDRHSQEMRKLIQAIRENDKTGVVGK